jgi:hypothetical protein
MGFLGASWCICLYTLMESGRFHIRARIKEKAATQSLEKRERWWLMTNRSSLRPRGRGKEVIANKGNTIVKPPETLLTWICVLPASNTKISFLREASFEVSFVRTAFRLSAVFRRLTLYYTLDILFFSDFFQIRPNFPDFDYTYVRAWRRAMYALTIIYDRSIRRVAMCACVH